MKYLEVLLSFILCNAFLPLHAEEDSSILLGNSTSRSAFLISAGSEGAAGAVLCYDDATLDNHVYMTGPAAFAFEGEIALPE